MNELAYGAWGRGLLAGVSGDSEAGLEGLHSAWMVASPIHMEAPSVPSLGFILYAFPRILEAMCN